MITTILTNEHFKETFHRLDKNFNRFKDRIKSDETKDCDIKKKSTLAGLFVIENGTLEMRESNRTS